MIPKTITNYGGPKIDAQPVSNPETQIAANEFNRAIEDTAQMTRTAYRAIVQWTTVTAAAPAPVPTGTIQVRTVWGNGNAQKPSIQKASAGIYTVTFPSTFTDDIGFIETVSFFDCHVSVRSSNPADEVLGRVLVVAGNVISVAVYSPVGTLADVGNVGLTPLTVTAWMV
jgi:hypothetical protein